MTSDLETLDRPTAEGLANLLVVVGDSKHWLGHWLSKWSVGAPGLESAVAAAAIAQGHFGQSRALFPFVEQYLGVEFAGPETRGRRYNVTALDDAFETWAEAVVALLLIDPALNVILRALENTQEELARRLGRVLDESRFTADFAVGRVTELTEHWERGREMLTPHVVPLLREMLCWFGPPGEAGVEHLREVGVLTLGNDQMRQAYLDQVAPPLLALGYELPVTGAPGGWTITEELPWNRWNPLQRRLEP